MAAGRYRCDSPGADSLTMTVHLQRNDGSSWTTISGQSFTAAGVATTLQRRNSERTRQIAVPCARGNYRTWVEATVVSRGVTRKLSENSGERLDPCS
ncbi:hypothetical protein GCM10007977_019920 [Dactylosporangium sucinum]|uniref:Uncharacterized protein n=2 Tax=Dactylosporangium sucinum TaxID=1424081 RepID=A0A917WP79_9ACTN|nr:hypothetical protein GCM10007977_019920 [Dactylosporangium sucinum]